MEKLCIFCKHFRWSKESMWGMGSTMTGPMMEGGDAACAKGHYEGKHPMYPEDESEFREIILRGQNCPDYETPNAEVSGAGTASAGLPGSAATDGGDDGDMG